MFGEFHNSIGGHGELEGVAKPRLVIPLPGHRVCSVRNITLCTQRNGQGKKKKQCRLGMQMTRQEKWSFTSIVFFFFLLLYSLRTVPSFYLSVTNQKIFWITFRASRGPRNHRNSIKYFWIKFLKGTEVLWLHLIFLIDR